MRRSRRDEEGDDVNLTPMLDIVFIMLIFFVVTASFVKESGIDISKPGGAQDQTKQKKGILVSIDRENQIWIEQRQVDVRAVRANIERLLAENPEGSVVVQASKRSEIDILVQVMDSARSAGVQNVSIAEGD